MARPRRAFRAWLTVRAAAFIAITAVACTRGESRVPPEGGLLSAAFSDARAPSLSTASPADDPLETPGRGPPVGLGAPEASGAPSGSGEAVRSVVRALDGEILLRPQLPALRAHFNLEARHGPQGQYMMQRIELAGGRTALLITKSDETEPIVLALDRDQLLWSKPRPVAGIAPPVVHLAIAPRPDGGVALFGYVASMALVASRMWTEDGSAFADLQVFAPGACDALSVAYGPARGWWVACASSAGVHVQRVRENGTMAWGAAGTLFGIAGDTGPATIVFDTSSTSVSLQRARGVAGDHLLASRYDDDGLPLWPTPIDVGGLPKASAGHGHGAEDRLRAASPREGVVRVELPRGLEGKRAQAVEIGSAGDIRVVK